MEELALFFLGFGLFLIFFLFVFLVLYVLAYWFIFAKAGEPGWKALIPIYSTYTEFKLFWNTKIFAVYMILAVVSNLLAWGGGTLAILSNLVSLGVMVIFVLTCVKMGQSFGKGPGFIVGLVLLNLIFLLILAFDSSRYLGPEGKSPLSDADIYNG